MPRLEQPYGQRQSQNQLQNQEQHPWSDLETTRTITSDTALAERVYTAVEEKLSSTSLIYIYEAFLSETPEKENIILRYLRLGFKLGTGLDAYHSHPDVYALQKAARRVGIEVHRFLGLLRFVQTPYFLYAPISPDHHILPLLGDHFADRLAEERFVIHDKRRKLAVIYDGKRAATAANQNPARVAAIRQSSRNIDSRAWYLCSLEAAGWEASAGEARYQALWRLYFDQISIQSRVNPRLQASFVPRRYRCYLTEFQHRGPLME